MNDWEPRMSEVGVTVVDINMVSEETTSMESGLGGVGRRHAFGGSFVIVIWEKKSRGNALCGGVCMGIPCDWQLEVTVS